MEDRNILVHLPYIIFIRIKLYENGNNTGLQIWMVAANIL
jgi:hypothetical protein